MLKGDGVWNFTMMFLQMWEVISGDKTEYNMYRPTVKNVVNNGYVIPYGDSLSMTRMWASLSIWV